MDTDQALKDLIVERLFLTIEPADISADEPLAAYGVDSFLLLELIVAIEEQFGVRFEQEDINPDTLRTIASLRSLIEEKSD